MPSPHWHLSLPLSPQAPLMSKLGAGQRKWEPPTPAVHLGMHTVTLEVWRGSESFCARHPSPSDT